MTLEQIVTGFAQDPQTTKANMVRAAYDVIIDHFEDCADLSMAELDTGTINYSAITGWLGWPDFQDGGIFEDAITIAATAAVSAYFGIKTLY